MKQDDRMWTDETLSEFLTNPDAIYCRHAAAGPIIGR